MKLWNRVHQYFHRDLWMADLEPLNRASRLKYRLLRLATVAVWEFAEGIVTLRAMGLVYTTLLSLVPFLAVSFSVLKAFGVHEEIEPLLTQALEPLGPRAGELTHYLVGFVSNLKVGVLGAVGTVGLFVTTVLLIDQIEGAMNSIWRVRRPRPLARKFSDYLSVILVGPVLLFTAVALTASAQSHWLVQRLMEFEPLGWLVLLATRAMPFMLACAAFTFLYKLVPYTSVRLTAALTGGVTAGILWQLAGWAFAAFVAGSSRYTAIYSSFAVLILFLIWLYVGWLIVLAGAQVAYYQQSPHAYMTRVLWRSDSHAFRERLAVRALVEITRRYFDGRAPNDIEELASFLNVPVASLEELLEEFVRRRILVWTAEPEGIALARPPEHVTACEILEILKNPDPFGVEPPPGEADPALLLLAKRDDAVRRALTGVTLRTLASDQGEASESDDSPWPQLGARSR